MRACDRSTFETSKGRPEASRATCASASSAGTTADPWPRAPSARSGSASASPSARAAMPISASGEPGATSSARSNEACTASVDSRWSSTGTPVATFVSPRPATLTRALARPCPVAAMVREGIAIDSPCGVSPGPELDVDAIDVRAEGAQAFVDSFVALVDLVHGADRRRAFRAEARQQHRHPGTNVRALHPLPTQLRGPGDNGTVRIAEDDAGSHAHELVREEQTVLEHLLEHEDRPLCLSCDRQRDRGEV